MTIETIFSPCRIYRYVLWREWDNGPLFTPRQITRQFDYVMFIGLNPSTADETKNDPTIRKCIGFAKRWHYGGLCMTNLFAYRATKPSDMLKRRNPEGPDNDKWLRECARDAGRIIVAWGKHGSHRAASSHLLTVLDLPDRNRVECLRVNGDGSPEHPLYIPYETTPKAWPQILNDNESPQAGGVSFKETTAATAPPLEPAAPDEEQFQAGDPSEYGDSN